jgi:hypothetical protein
MGDTGAELKDEVDHLVLVEDIVELDDVGVVQGSQDHDLSVQSGERLGVQTRHAHDLGCEFYAGPAVLSDSNGGEGSCAE